MKLEETEDLGKGVSLEMVLIPSGTFMMGSPESKEERFDNEKQYEVTLTKSYYMGKYEVTQEQWEAVMGKNPSSKTKGAKLPVTDVSWKDCQKFIKKLNAKTNSCYRLPTEAEWEYACRAGTKTEYSFGANITPKDANYYDSKIHKPVAVGTYKPNAFGLYDMHGNVWELCEDWYGDYPAGSVTDPKGPATQEIPVLRGGSFLDVDSNARSSIRCNYAPSLRHFTVGFRLARTDDVKDTVATTVIKPDSYVIIPATGNLLVVPFTEAKAKKVQRAIAKSLKKEVEEKADLGKDVKLEMVLIPAGTFMMGSPASEKSRHNDETQHEVTLTKSYYMGKYEVTQEQWEAVMGKNPSSKTKGAKLPVTDVSWEDCQEFIKKLNAKTDGGYRLPTEAEWEYACRAGTTTAYSVGAKITPQDANYDVSKIGKPVAVGSYKPNAFGLYDMHGNVWEWCEDWYGGYQAGSVTDPKGLGTGECRVLRGGSFNLNVSNARSSNRVNDTPTLWYDSLGFRLARTDDVKDTVATTVIKPDSYVIIPATGNLLVVPFTEAKAKKVQRAVAKSLQKEVEEKTDLGKEVKLEMVLIPAGTFMMGSPKSEEDRYDKETQHLVTLTKPFYMCKFAVMQVQWQSVMGNNPSGDKGPKLPVTNVSWNDCQEFIKKLNKKTDGGYSLPTEAEWEYACRAGTTTAYSFGDKITPKDANYDDSKIGKPVEVGSYRPNAFGLYDMHGNVWEWCEDWYEYYPEGAVTDPEGPEKGNFRVLRGGSVSNYVSRARSSDRVNITPSDRFSNVGFRLARTAL